jgi:hypothetical protein
MSLVTGGVPSFIAGVSQQAPALRLASQAEEQINGWPSVATGLDKRPPTEHAARLSTAAPLNAFLHIINRDLVERYVVVVASGDLKVYRFDGTEVSVAFPDGKGYLTGADFTAVTVADFTFVANRSIAVAMDPAVLAPSRNPEALLAVRVGNYSTTYNVTLTPQGGSAQTASFTTSNTDAATIRTDNIAEQLRTTILGWNNGWLVDRVGSTLLIRRTGGGDFTILSADSFGDQGLIAVKGKVQSTALLPARAFGGFQVEVEGSSGNRFDNHYVAYSDSATAGSQGTWVEIPKPGRRIRLNAATMPHILVREANGSFTFRRAQWADCRCGDENTNPEPALIGKRVSDVFFYRNRLGMIGGEAILMSRSGRFFDTWRETAMQLLDTDPIDVSVSHVKVSDLHWAVPFNETLLLFSEQTQFIDNSGSVLTPATVDFRQVTEFDASVRSRPKGVGPFIYFGAPRGGFTSVREYFLDGASRAANANDITAHVPNYIKGEVVDMAVSSTEDCLAAIAANDRRSLFLYKFQFSNSEKVQAAWFRWEFPAGDTLLAAEFINSSLWLVIARADGLYLERVDTDPGRSLGALSWVPKLDRLILGDRAATVTYDAANDRTTFTLPYSEAGPMEGFVITSAAGFTYGRRFLDPLRPSETQIAVPGNWTSTAARQSIVFGRRYELRHTFSPLMVRVEAPGGGAVATTDGRLQLGTMRVNYSESGYFRVEVTPFRRRTYRYPFTGRIVGSARNLLGAPSLNTGTFSFPIRTSNLNTEVVIINDSPMPSRFLNAEWEGVYTPRSRRVD